MGAYFNYHFGKMEKSWKVDYASDLFWDTSDELTRKMWGYNVSAGIIVNPVSTLHIGAVYSPSYHLTFQEKQRNSTKKGSYQYTIDLIEDAEKTATIPEIWGFGLSYTLKKKYRFAADFLYEPWSKFKVNDIVVDQFNDRKRFGFGAELLPSKSMLASYYEKMTYRLGYFYQQLDFVDENGKSVFEYGFSVGFGFPYYHNFGRVDLALRYGTRGNLSDNFVKENIFQIFISVTGGEQWFVRRGRK